MHGPRLVWLVWCAAAIALATGDLGAQAVNRWTFDADPAGRLPAAVTLAALRQPSPGEWTVAHTRAGRFLHHSADAGVRGWAMALLPVEPLRDVELSARIRLSEGTHAGGLVWRYQNALSFHAAVLDLDEQRIAVYRVTDGNRVRLESRDGLELDTNGWHTVKVVHEGARISVSIGGIRVLQETEKGADPLASGGIGVLSEGRAGVAFDDVRVDERRRH